ncbi:MAG: hypothetical protein QOK49_1632, partial [Baekduia sp.]|nr:hypothetical protein [Baekduia sp.]
AAGLMLHASRAAVPDGATPARLAPAAHVERALDATGRPWTSAATRARLLRLAQSYADTATGRGRPQSGADMTQRALRQLILAGPDYQVH